MQNIGWSHYVTPEGFGGGNQFTEADLAALSKALQAGSAINNPGPSPGEGFPLRVESLEHTLKNVTLRAEHLRLYKAMPKIPAYNTTEEHNVISSYGQQGEGFVAEMERPNTTDATYERKYATVKYMGVTREVSHVMSLVTPAHGPVIAQETMAGTMSLLEKLERALFVADSALSSLQFDGFAKLIASMAPPTNIVDMRDQPLSEDALIDGSLTISDEPNYGIPTHVHMNPKVKADLIKTFFPKGRYDLLEKPSDGMIGLDMKGFTSPAGQVLFEANSFINDGGPPPVAAGGDLTRAPSAPTISTGATTPPNSASKFGALDAGNYFYTIVAHNDYGHSPPVAVDGAAIAIAAGDDLRFGVTAAGGNPTKWYSLYRSRKDGVVGVQRLVRRVPAVSSPLTVIDLNEDIPFTTKAYLWQQNLDCLSWKQLAPMLKIPLAVTRPAIEWMQLIYGVPVLYAPGRAVLYKNIGRAPNFVGAP